MFVFTITFLFCAGNFPVATIQADAKRWHTIGSVESQTYSDIWRENWPRNCVEPFQPNLKSCCHGP